jgi:putative phosphoserine phosphatase/1-acylglycerol-3-phosphate O-acyltransferase
VIHNAADVLPKGGFLIRPSRVIVDVLEPVSTDGWRADTVDLHVREIRNLYLDALGQSTQRETELKRVK